MSDDRKLLAAWTPQIYSGAFPPYINLTMVRLKGDVVITARAPTTYGGPPGNTSSITLTREAWRALLRILDDAEKVYEACDFLDSAM